MNIRQLINSLRQKELELGPTTEVIVVQPFDNGDMILDIEYVKEEKDGRHVDDVNKCVLLTGVNKMGFSQMGEVVDELTCLRDDTGEVSSVAGRLLDLIIK